MPELDTGNWQLILAKIDVAYHGQLFYGKGIEVRTYIGRIGGASFDVYQELWQQGEKCAGSTAVMVHFCYQEQASIPIPQAIKDEMQQHLLVE